MKPNPRAIRSVLLLLPALLAAPAGGRAEAPRIALIIGNAAYAALPALPACAASAALVATALRQAGFAVSERHDLSNGEMGAALDALAGRLDPAGGAAAAVIYVCGYVAALDQRVFLLPVAARIEREGDLLTQGVLAKTLLGVIAKGAAPAALVLLDGFARPGSAAPDFTALAQVPLAPGQGFAAALEPVAATETALARAVAAGPVDAGFAALLRSVWPKLETASVPFTVHAPAAVPPAPPPQPPAPPPPAPPPAAVPPAPAPPPPAPPSPAQMQPPPAPAPTLHFIPSTVPRPLEEPAGTIDENTLAMADRIRLQAALARLGFFTAKVDGFYRPSSRVAIRRFQQSIGAAQTGWLTAAEAERLLAAAKAAMP